MATSSTQLLDPPRAPPRADLIDRLAALAARNAPHAVERMTIHAPFTGQAIGEVPRATAEDVALAARRSRELQPAWAATPLSQRAAVLLRFHDLVLERRDEVLDLLQLEGGKARIHALEEVLDAAINARYYGRTASRHLRTRRRRGVFPVLTQTWEHHHPRGIVGVIAPWNYPLALGISDALPALVAGNGTVLKPDGSTPFSALWAADVLEQAGLPGGLAQVVTGSGSELGTPIIDNSDYVMFTGSTRVGRDVARQAGERLLECSMELGGKNAMIVLRDADLERTAQGAMRAAFTNAGQLCISMERLYVDATIHDDFVARLVERTRALRLGAQLDWSADVGSILSEKQLQTVHDHVEDAVAKGATVLAGGRPRPDVGPLFYEPTLLTGVTPEMTAHGNETFGPVLSVYSFQTPDEAVQLANDSPYGLNFSVWSKDTKAARRLATRLQAGTVNINEGYSAAWASVDAPMGGFKQSGTGRRHGEHGIHKYTQSQTIAVQRGVAISTPPGRNTALRARLWIAGLRLLRRLPGVD
jgi:succinate-semialdehyde dehydrogenase / glutarate-semialdehyde dehydrogenase